MMEHLSPETVMALADGELPDPEAAFARAHLSACAACGALATDSRTLSRSLAAWAVDDAPGSLDAGVQAPSQAKSTHGHRLARAIPVIVGILVVIVIAGVILIRQVGRTTSHPVIATPPGTPVLVVLYLDYQCPPCRHARREYGEVVDRHNRERPDSVRLVIEDYPLDSTCNPAMKTPYHPAACAAAAAVRVAAERGRQGAMEDWLFDHQAALTPAVVKDGMRAVIGETSEDDYKRAMTALEASVKRWQELKINSAPTVFINGKSMPGLLNADAFDRAVTQALASVR